MTKLLRFFADAFFAKRYGPRAIVLETVAAVPGMVGATGVPMDRPGFGWIRYRQKPRKSAVFWTLLDVCGEVDGAGDGIELTEIQKLIQRLEQYTVSPDTVTCKCGVGSIPK